MHPDYIEDMVRKLKPVLKDSDKARVILNRYWRTRMALVWMVADVHKAANERGVAMTNLEAIDVLQTLLHQHNPQLGIRWEDLTGHIESRLLGRKMTGLEIKRFVSQDLITVQK